MTKKLVEAAARASHIQILHYLFPSSSQEQSSWAAKVCCTAAEAGQLEVLERACFVGFPLDEEIFHTAVFNK